MNASHYLGIGMYTPSEAAMYARVKTQLISRWVHGSASGSAAFRAQLQDDESKTVTFLDLIQAMAIRAIRTQEHTVTLQAIRQAVDFAATQGIQYPFARKHTTYILGNKILIQTPGYDLLEASGKHRGQANMRKIVEVYMQDVGFDADGLANRFTAFQEDGVKIILNPGYKFGEPTVHPSGHTAWTLWEACHSEGGIKEAAKAYGVKEKEVLVAYRYVETIRPATAA